MQREALILFPKTLNCCAIFCFPIMQLKKEVKELTLQLDLAQGQIKDLLQLVGDDRPALVPVCLVELKHSLTLRYFLYP